MPSTWGASVIKASRVIEGDPAFRQLIRDQRMAAAEPDQSHQSAGLGLGEAGSVDELALRSQVALGDVTVDRMELDQLSDGESSAAFGLGEESDGAKSTGADITNRSPPACLGCRQLRQSHTQNTTQGV